MGLDCPAAEKLGLSPISPRGTAETIDQADGEIGGCTSFSALCYEVVGAGDGIRTRDIDLGKVALYQLSYSRMR